MDTIFDGNTHTEIGDGGSNNTPILDIGESMNHHTQQLPKFDPILRRRKRINDILSPKHYLDTNDFLNKIKTTLRRLYNTPGINIHLLKKGQDGKYYDIVTRSEIEIGAHFRTKDTATRNNGVYVPIGNKDLGDDMIFQITGMPERHQSEILVGIREFWKNGKDTLDLIHDRNRDELTGLYNKLFENKYGNTLDQEGKNALYGVAVIDLRKFKQINDRYGHTIGDEALKRFAECMQHVFQRDSERPIRHGGDEFSIVFRFAEGTSIEKQQQIVEGGMKRLQDHIHATNNNGGFDLGKSEDNSPIVVQLLFRHGISLYSSGDSQRDTFAKVWNKADPPKSKGREEDPPVL